MSDEHTPEPWQWRDELLWSGDSIVVAGDGYRCLDMVEADARRIVACVNACAGVSTEDLERMLLDESLSDEPIRWQLDDLRMAEEQGYPKNEYGRGCS